MLCKFTFNVIKFIIVCVFCHAGNIVKEFGPVSMTFTIPMYNCSRLQVKNYLTWLGPMYSYGNKVIKVLSIPLNLLQLCRIFFG